MTISHSCDVCNYPRFLEIPCLADYGLAGQIVVCGRCGFVYVPNRRSEQEVADAWSYEIFGDAYTSDVPYVAARLFWVASELASQVDLKTMSSICDVGCGEGELLSHLQRLAPNSVLAGIDPSPRNVAALSERGVTAWHGTAQSISGSGELDSCFDVITLTWTLENSNDCRSLLRACSRMLKPGGYLAVATGSRILVPFKKPLDKYLSGSRNPDTHAFRWSRRSLSNLLEQLGFSVFWENSWRDSDWLMLIARKERDRESSYEAMGQEGDDPASVVDFFESWHAHSLRLAEWERAR